MMNPTFNTFKNIHSAINHYKICPFCESDLKPDFYSYGGRIRYTHFDTDIVSFTIELDSEYIEFYVSTMNGNVESTLSARELTENKILDNLLQNTYLHLYCKNENCIRNYYMVISLLNSHNRISELSMVFEFFHSGTSKIVNFFPSISWGDYSPAEIYVKDSISPIITDFIQLHNGPIGDLDEKIKMIITFS